MDPHGPISSVSDRRAADTLVRQAGLRLTRARQAVVEVLIEAEAPLEASELTRRARERVPGVHPATIYRTVSTLAEVGLVDHLHAGHGPALLRLAGRREVMLACRGCGVTVPVGDRLTGVLAAEVEQATGFVVDLGHFALEGLCASCAAGVGGARGEGP